MLHSRKQPAIYIALLLIAGCFLLSGVASVLAIATGYASNDTDLQPGMTVSLTEGSDTNPSVERAVIGGTSHPIGVTVAPDQNIVTTGAESKQVYVQTTGEVDAFVSDLNGIPKKGDFLSISPLKGVLVKSDSLSGASIVGAALEDFSEDSLPSQTIEKSGTAVSVKIDRMRISLDQKGQSFSNEAESGLEKLGRSVTGRSVGEIRVVIALVIFLIVLISEGGIIYGAVSSAITALGRNPMARRTIIKELLRVIGIALVVLGIGLAAIYAILWV